MTQLSYLPLLTNASPGSTLGGRGEIQMMSASTLDVLAELLRKAEDYSFHHAAKNRQHFRSWQLAQVLYDTIAALVDFEKEEPGDDSTPAT